MPTELWHVLRNMRKRWEKISDVHLKMGASCIVASHERQDLGFPGSSYSPCLSLAPC